MSDVEWISDEDSGGDVSPKTTRETLGIAKVQNRRAPNLSQQRTARKQPPAAKAANERASIAVIGKSTLDCGQGNDDEWRSDDDSDGFVTPDEASNQELDAQRQANLRADAARKKLARAARTPKSAAVQRADHAAGMQQARGALTPTSAANQRADDAAGRKQARGALTPTSAANQRADNAAGMKQARGALTPKSAAVQRAGQAAGKKHARSHRTPTKAEVQRAGNAAAMKKVRKGHQSPGTSPVKSTAAQKRERNLPLSAAKKRSNVETSSSKQRSREVNPSVLLNLDDAFEQSQWIHNKVFSDAELVRLEAEFDHDPAAAVAWMAASSQASFGFKNCPMDEQLEAVLGTDCSKV